MRLKGSATLPPTAGPFPLLRGVTASRLNDKYFPLRTANGHGAAIELA